MIIVGCDFHPTWQQVAWVDTETGETAEGKLEHSSGEAREFYSSLSVPALIGVEATGNCQWFLDLMVEAGGAPLKSHNGPWEAGDGWATLYHVGTDIFLVEGSQEVGALSLAGFSQGWARGTSIDRPLT